jgi:hypothetical protein
MDNVETSIPKTRDEMCEWVMEESAGRCESYYDVAKPGEDDSPISILDFKHAIPVIIWIIVLVAIWLIGRWVILPIYY